MAESDDKSQAPPPPPKPTPKTSTVPLKKETVRITLRAKPASGDTATVPPVAPMQPSGPGEDDATATAPVSEDDATATAPVAPPAPKGAPAPPAGAKTIPLAKAPGAPAAKPPAGAKTIPLAKAPAAAGAAAAPAGAKTTPLQPAASGAVKPLPKATVQLQKTQPMAGGSPTAAIQRGPATGGVGLATTALEGVEEEDEESGIMPYAIIVLLLAIIVLAIELLTKFTPS